MRKIIMTVFLCGMVLIGTLLLFHFFLRPDQSVLKEKKPIIVCTTMFLKDAIINLISEEHAQVHALMGPGVDPHTYRARPSDITTLLSATLVIYNGLHLEGKMGEILHDLKEKKVVICATDTIARDQLIASEYQHIYDPHIWHDPVLWSSVVAYLAAQLMDHFKEQKEEIEKKHAAYQVLLTKLHQDIEYRVNAVAVQQRILITAHDAFRYFGKRYQFQVLALQGLSTESEIGLRNMTDLADVIVTRGVKTIFPESCISPRNMLALQERVRKKGMEVTLGQELFSDALSGETGPAPTYLKMLLYNATCIIDAVSEKAEVVIP